MNCEMNERCKKETAIKQRNNKHINKLSLSQNKNEEVHGRVSEQKEFLRTRLKGRSG